LYKPAITYLEIVEKRDAATLLPIIRKFRHEDKHFEGCFLSNQILTNDESLILNITISSQTYNMDSEKNVLLKAS